MKALFLLATFFAGASAHAYPFPTNWQPVLRCDNGAAVVDVNTYERRMVQLVIRNPQIYDYLSGVAELQSTAMNFDGARKEIVVPASVGNGVFEPAQFQGFEADATMRPAIRVYRQGKGLEVRAVDVSHYVCTDYRQNDYYCAAGYWTQDRDVASWYFQSCE